MKLHSAQKTSVTSPRVVIVGAGFGGLSAAKQLARAPFDVTVVDRHNYHLFQPLLYQVVTAGLSPGDIASPIRGILHRQMGDSDKPKNYAYSTAERTDLVEAIWRDLGVQSTTLVAFDFSSLVVLEHLRRRLERSERGEPPGGPDIRGVFIFNGGLFTDGHSHPWYTTPMLRRLPKGAWRGVGRPFALFRWMPGVRKMWSKGYHITDAELRELHSALDRHDGLFYLAAAASFQADHKAQGDRLDFGRLFNAYRDQYPFLVGGSDEDPFEHRQVDFAEERLGHLGLQVERLPGGHLTTNEQPEALAGLIANFERGVQKRS